MCTTIPNNTMINPLLTQTIITILILLLYTAFAKGPNTSQTTMPDQSTQWHPTGWVCLLW